MGGVTWLNPDTFHPHPNPPPNWGGDVSCSAGALACMACALTALQTGRLRYGALALSSFPI